MIKRLTALTMSFVILLALTVNAFAHGKEGTDGHDQFLEWVLFGSKTYKKTISESSEEFKAIEALEYAVALCVDQGSQQQFDTLQSLRLAGAKIHGIPDEFSQIALPGGSHHRRYSHKGWDGDINGVYNDDYSTVREARKDILLQAVNQVFGFQAKAGTWNFLWIEKDYGYDEQCEAFAEFLYYIHIIADIDGASMDEGYSDMIKLAYANDSPGSPSIYDELLRILPIIFASQTNSPSYTGLITDIKLQAQAAQTFVKSTPDIKSNYSQYQQYGMDLLEKLANKIPSLLKNEQFFKAVFYNTENAEKVA